MQEIITYSIVILATAFLIKKLFLKPKNKKDCDTGCGCS